MKKILVLTGALVLATSMNVFAGTCSIPTTTRSVVTLSDFVIQCQENNNDVVKVLTQNSKRNKKNNSCNQKDKDCLNGSCDTTKAPQVTTQKPVETTTRPQVTTTRPQVTTEKPTEVTTQAVTEKPTEATTERQTETTTVNQASKSMEEQVVDLVNKERAKQGLQALKINSNVSKVAQVKSEDMRDKKYFDHTSPTYGSPFDMLKQFNINYSYAGENIARGQKTAEAVVTAWMNSEGHRKNILSANFTEIGVGYATGGSGPYWTQLFIK